MVRVVEGSSREQSLPANSIRPAELDREGVPNLIYFNEDDKGGHFVTWEQPELFAEGLRAAFSMLR